MTHDEMIALGKACLAEYEPHLKILGPVEPYQDVPTVAKMSFKGSTHWLDEKQMRDGISRVLDELAAVKHGFKMSEPDPFLKSLYKVDTVSHGENLNLSFVTMWDATNLEPITHIVCWYYPLQ